VKAMIRARPDGPARLSRSICLSRSRWSCLEYRLMDSGGLPEALNQRAVYREVSFRTAR
jgi:hypothetical protein